MTYTQQLNKARELGLSIFDLTIADECDSAFDFDYTTEQFDELCYLVGACWLKNESEDITLWSIANCINTMVGNGCTLDEILEMTPRELLEKTIRVVSRQKLWNTKTS